MAKKKKSRGDDNIDWYLISIDRLKQIGLVVLILLLGGAGWWFWQKEQGNPQANAESAIADARQSLNALASSPTFNDHRPEFDRAQRKLEEANALLVATKFGEAQGAAAESLAITKAALAGVEDQENDAQFLTVEGDVKFQKGSSGDWKDAEARGALFNGDWVKTGGGASAELIFANGSLYTIGPNALLEIYAVFNPSTSKKTNAVQMQVGTVEVATTDDVSSVHTPGNRVVVESESTTHVGVNAAKATSVLSMKGATSVVAQTGQQVKLATGDTVSSTEQGSLSDVRKLPLPPALGSPGDNQTFQLAGEPRVEFVWNPQGGVSRYMLQVSRSRLFSTLEINEPRTRTSASAKVTEEGNFYWRVASVGPGGEVGPYSPFRRFRVVGGVKTGSGVTGIGDATSPPLTMKPPQHMGGPFWTIGGATEAGASVFINDEEVDVESDGSFQKLIGFTKIGVNAVVIKAVDAAGNQTTKSQSVRVEE